MTDSAPTPPGRSAVGLRSERGPVLLSVMLTTSLVALDAVIIATAVPAIVDDLGGFSQFPWLFSTYLLAQAVSVPIYGKLSDVVGRKPVMVFGVLLFLLGSVLCGAAWSMTVLIIARAVQGLGAGAVLPMGVTIIGDLYSVEERARVQGYVASVWGASSVIGPAVGGVFSDFLSWRWIFFINLPIGAIALWKLWAGFHENVTRRRVSIDYAGAILLAGGFSLLILALLEGGSAWAWLSLPSISILAVSAVMLVSFVLVEKRAAEPIIPLWIFTRRVLVGANLVGVLVGVLLTGISSYIPTYAQEVLGASAVVAGFALAAMTIGWPISAGLSGRLYTRIGFRDTSLIGAVVIIAGSLLLLLLDKESAVWLVAAVCFLLGVGLGLVASPTLVAVQSVVGWDRRGVVTGTNLFGRSMGSALGVAVFGAIVNGNLTSRFANPPAGVTGTLPTSADDTSLILGRDSTATDTVQEFVRSALSDSMHEVFLGVVVAAVLLLVGLGLMPRRTSPLQFAEEAGGVPSGTDARTTASDRTRASSLEGPGGVTKAEER